MSQTIEWTRARIVRQMISLKQYISQLPDNREMLARLSGKDGDRFLQVTVDFIMEQLGHKSERESRRARQQVSGG